MEPNFAFSVLTSRWLRILLCQSSVMMYGLNYQEDGRAIALKAAAVRSYARRMPINGLRCGISIAVSFIEFDFVGSR